MSRIRRYVVVRIDIESVGRNRASVHSLAGSVATIRDGSPGRRPAVTFAAVPSRQDVALGAVVLGLEFLAHG
jgi:hypothetical protein